MHIAYYAIHYLFEWAMYVAYCGRTTVDAQHKISRTHSVVNTTKTGHLTRYHYKTGMMIHID